MPMLSAAGAVPAGLDSTRIVAPLWDSAMARVPSWLSPSTTRISSRSCGYAVVTIESRHALRWRSSLRHGTITDTNGMGVGVVMRFAQGEREASIASVEAVALTRVLAARW